MPVQKISEMTAITGSTTASDDLFLVVDSSTNITKKINIYINWWIVKYPISIFFR